ncbi:acetoacetate--CoA ligase [Blastococcus sp. TF02A-30]|nr:acetoacetate--CoA ligase [Blastococcus sp. TF02A-30]
MPTVDTAGTPPQPAQLAGFRRQLEERTGLDLRDPVVLHRFSVEQPAVFWHALLEWTGLPWSGSADPVVTGTDVETARFFPGVRLNYAEALLRPLDGVDDDAPALTGVHADGPADCYTRAELRAAVQRGATALARLGLAAGDRVVAVAPSTADVVVAALSVAALGGTLSTATPDMGTTALLGRFEQVEPVLVLLDRRTVDDPDGTVAALLAGLPTARSVVLVDDLPLPEPAGIPAHRWADLSSEAGDGPPAGWPRLPFDHPLFVMFSSGTTGPPKAMVHGAGGTLLEHVKEHRLHGDLRAGETLYFHTTTAWMMWNWQLSALAVGAHVVVYDGPVTGPATLWEIAADHRVQVLGTSPPYLQLCQDEGYRPAEAVDLSALRAVLSTGAVLHEWQFDWVAEAVGPQPLQSISGGTDIIGCFVLGHPELPVRRGRSQARSLGLDVVAVDGSGVEVVGRIGELVCRRPFPSRPVAFLRDSDGARFHDAYFAEHPGVWTHGDLVDVDADGSARVHGRSDGVLNIDGIRIGPSEIYAALHAVPEVVEALAVEQRHPHRPGATRMVLLVLLAAGAVLDGRLDREIRATLRRRASAAHVPSLVVAVPELPLTHNGKRSERAARDAVNGDPVGNRSALRNPGSLETVRAAVLAAVVAPAADGDDDAPTVVRRLWRQALGLADSHPDDDFFDLGGTSRQLVSLLHRVREDLGADVPVSEFAPRPTLAELLRRVAAAAPTPAGVRLLREGDGAPVFLVPDVGRAPADYADLARLLDTDRPVHALPVDATAADGSALSLADAGARVLAALPLPADAPCVLVGHGLGGVLAAEVAARLEAEGADVSAVVLIDAPPPAAALPRHLAARIRWSGRLTALRAPDRADLLLQRFAERFAPATLSPERLAHVRAHAAFDAHRPGRFGGAAVHLGPPRSPVPAAWRRVLPGLVAVEVPGAGSDVLAPGGLPELAGRLSAALAGAGVGAGKP